MSQSWIKRTNISVLGLAACCAVSLAASANSTPNRKMRIFVLCEGTMLRIHYSVQAHPDSKVEAETHTSFESWQPAKAASPKECEATAKKFSDRDKVYTTNQFSSAFASQVDAFIKARDADPESKFELPAPPLSKVAEKRMVGTIDEIDCNADGSGNIKLVVDHESGFYVPGESIIKPGNKKLCESLRKKLRVGTKVRIRDDDGFYAAYQFLAPPPKEEPARAIASDTDSDTTTKPKDTDGGKDVTKAE